MVAGVGVAGVVVGSVFGLTASAKWSSAKNECNPSCSPSSPALGEKSDAQSAATVSTVAFAVGGAAIATGAVLFFLAPRSVTVAPAVGAGTGGVTVMGRF